MVLELQALHPPAQSYCHAPMLLDFRELVQGVAVKERELSSGRVLLRVGLVMAIYLTRSM
jgi:hypothetical protein